MSDPNYFEQTYQGPFKGIDVSLPENKISPDSTPFAQNWFLRGGELRTRPRINRYLPPLPDGSQIVGLESFLDANSTYHSVVISSTGLWQINSDPTKRDKAYSLIQLFPATVQGSTLFPVNIQVFLNTLYFVNGSYNTWSWDGMAPNALNQGPALISVAKYDNANGLYAGGFFLGELNSRLIILNTVEIQADGSVSKFPQRIRWSASGLPTIWDPAVNIGAGFNNEVEVPDDITGFLTIGSSGFILRTNGITEMTPVSSGLLPFDFNHLWASSHGIGNVYPFSIAGYGPIGIFIAEDDIYNLSLGGFKKIGGKARNAIYLDLANAVTTPVSSVFASYQLGFPYLTYRIAIQLVGNVTKIWDYFIEDEAWMAQTFNTGVITGKSVLVPTI